MKASSVEPAVAIRVRIAAGLFARARGLLWHPDLAPGAGLLLAGVRIVHGFGLRRALDLAYLDGEGRVLACDVLAPRRVSGCLGAAHVVELRRGECGRLQLVPGRRLQLTIVNDIFDGSRSSSRPGHAPSSGDARRVIVGCVIASALVASPWLAAEAAPGADRTAGVAPETRTAARTTAEATAQATAEATTVDRQVGKPRRKRVRKARASLHRDAAAGTPAQPLRKARRRQPERQAPVEYLVGEPGRHGAKPQEQAAQRRRKDEPDRRR